jgi:hypothetical protein
MPDNQPIKTQQRFNLWRPELSPAPQDISHLILIDFSHSLFVLNCFGIVFVCFSYLEFLIFEAVFWYLFLHKKFASTKICARLLAN